MARADAALDVQEPAEFVNVLGAPPLEIPGTQAIMRREARRLAGTVGERPARSS